MKDYSNYFKGPSLNEAKRRSRDEVGRYDDAYHVPGDMVKVGLGKKYYIQTYGCQANERDSETLSGILESMSYQPTTEIKEADVIVLNTCAIRENAEEKVFGKVGYVKNLKKTNPNLIFAMCGCMAQEEVVVNRILEKHPHVDLIFGTHNIHRLPELLKDALYSKEMIVEVWSKEGDVIENAPVRRDNKYKAWVNIMYGCDKFCTYCIVPYTRGKERSRTMEDVLDEIRTLKQEGFKEVTLLGQNVNSYGKDLHIAGGFAKLLEETAKIGIERIRFTTSHPWDFSDEMVDVIAQYDNIMPFIHLPVQSGDSDVLKLMGRRYSIEQYKTLFHKIEEKIPGCAISTDIIVGFPNETKEQFQHTLDLVDECKFDNAFTFIYSPREGTPAARMEDNIPLEEKQERLQQLNERWNKYALEKNLAYIGKTVKVLVDGPSKKNKDIYSGYTDTNKLVNFVRKDAEPGDIVEVKITDAKTFSLDGEQL